MTLFYCFYSAFPLHVLQIKQFQGHYFIVSIVLSHFMFFRANSFNDIILLFLQCFPTSCSSEQTVSMTLFYYFYSAFPLHVFNDNVLSHFMFRANSFNDIILLFLQCFPTSCSSDQAVSRTLFYCFYSAFPLHVLQSKQFQGHYFIVSIVLSHFMFFRANSFNDIILLFLQCFPTSCSSEQTVSMTLFYCFYSAHLFFRANSFNDIILLFLQCFPTSCSSDQAVSRTLFYCFYSAFPLHVLQSKQFQ